MTPWTWMPHNCDPGKNGVLAVVTGKDPRGDKEVANDVKAKATSATIAAAWGTWPENALPPVGRITSASPPRVLLKRLI